jgi:hypothetical protein
MVIVCLQGIDLALLLRIGIGVEVTERSSDESEYFEHFVDPFRMVAI